MKTQQTVKNSKNQCIFVTKGSVKNKKSSQMTSLIS